MAFITKSDIATTCDFGSQMSQYASMLCIAKKYNYEVLFLKEKINDRWKLPLKEPFIHVPKIVSIHDLKDFKLSKITGNLSDHQLDPNVNYDLHIDLGLFTHFDEIRSEILEVYKFKEEIQEFSKNYIKNIKTDENDLLVSLHFRRGDYLQFSSLNLSMDYYIEAINKMTSLYPDNNLKFLVFSNDLEWCKQNIVGECIFVENLGRYHDMCIMSLCDHNIIANSSFSWWGAYLNKSLNKTVICPHDYLNVPGLNHLVNGKYYPKEWVALNTL
jgi:hypothetical protein